MPTNSLLAAPAKKAAQEALFTPCARRFYNSFVISYPYEYSTRAETKKLLPILSKIIAWEKWAIAQVLP